MAAGVGATRGNNGDATRGNNGVGRGDDSSAGWVGVFGTCGVGGMTGLGGNGHAGEGLVLAVGLDGFDSGMRDLLGGMRDLLSSVRDSRSLNCGLLLDLAGVGGASGEGQESDSGDVHFDVLIWLFVDVSRLFCGKSQSLRT